MKKNIFTIFVAVFLLVLVLAGTKIQSVDDYYLTHIDEIKPDSKTITITIRCDTILDNWDKLDPALKFEKYVPHNGVILPETRYVLRPKDTVFDVLDRAVRHNKIQMECMYHKGYDAVYIQGINHVYEFSCGELSGWMYRVNGTHPNYGVSKYNLSDGDRIEILYTCDLGRDLGHTWEE